MTGDFFRSILLLYLLYAHSPSAWGRYSPLTLPFLSLKAGRSSVASFGVSLLLLLEEVTSYDMHTHTLAQGFSLRNYSLYTQLSKFEIPGLQVESRGFPPDLSSSGISLAGFYLVLPASVPLSLDLPPPIFTLSILYIILLLFPRLNLIL